MPYKMSQESVKKAECIEHMSTMDKSLRGLFWRAMVGVFIISSTVVGAYWKMKTDKINKIATASIKADERLGTRLDALNGRQINVERQQAAMGARIDANMKWLMDACSRIESKQTRIEERLNTP